MTHLGRRLKLLREELGISQVAIGAQGFVSAPGWIKMENGQRPFSEKLIAKLCAWLVADKHASLDNADALHDELLLRKYLDHPSAFVRKLAAERAESIRHGHAILDEVRTSAQAKPKRGRPLGSGKGNAGGRR